MYFPKICSKWPKKAEQEKQPRESLTNRIEKARDISQTAKDTATWGSNHSLPDNALDTSFCMSSGYACVPVHVGPQLRPDVFNKHLWTHSSICLFLPVNNSNHLSREGTTIPVTPPGDTSRHSSVPFVETYHPGWTWLVKKKIRLL